MSEIKNFIKDVDWPLMASINAKLLALVCFAWATLKVVLVAQAYGALVALVFAGMHLPLCLFSALFVLWFYDHALAAGFLALVSTLLNALLI